MPTKKAAKTDKPPLEGNPPGLQTCYTVKGHGHYCHIAEDNGWATITQIGNEIKLPMGLVPAVRAALEALEKERTFLVFKELKP